VTFRSKIYYDMGLGLLSVVDLRAQNIDTLASIERTSVDYYATTRNLYLQFRKAAVNRGKPDVENLPDF
jgi:phospholipid-binding lipoprotein MlaA